MQIQIKGIIDTDFVNYKKCCMTIMMPYCNGFKCGAALCQNSSLATAPNISMSIDEIVEMYVNNPITEAICLQGLEPLDSPELFALIGKFRTVTQDDIVIYTGYTMEELEQNGNLKKLKNYGIINIIIKTGRFLEGDEPHYDEVLGVNLASNNQYAERIC